MISDILKPKTQAEIDEAVGDLTANQLISYGVRTRNMAFICLAVDRTPAPTNINISDYMAIRMAGGYPRRGPINFDVLSKLLKIKADQDR